MPVTLQTPLNQYTGNGSTQEFAYTFYLLNEADLKVYLNDSNTAESSGYTVSGVGEPSGGTVTFDTAPTDGYNVRLERRTELIRTRDWQTGGEISSEGLDNDSDKLTQIAQEINRRAFQEDPDGTLNAGTRRLKNLVDPSADQDAATKAWTNTRLSAELTDNENNVTYSEEWANKAEDSLVSSAAGGDQVDDYSSLHHANKSSASASAASSSASAASSSASSASTSASNAATSEGNASTSETNAATSASNASTSESNASTSATNASNSASAASTSASNASTSETNAASSATSASVEAGAAASSATNAATSESNAAAEVVNAQAEVTYATQWANKAEDSLITAAAGGDEVDDYSALHHANKAAASATSASSSASDAAASAVEAADSAATITNALSYQGAWDASTGSYPSSPTPATGHWYKVVVAGTVDSISYAAGDAIVYNALGSPEIWDKIDNTESGTFGDITQTETVTGNWDFTGYIRVENNAAYLQFNESDADPDESLWLWGTNNGVMQLLTRTGTSGNGGSGEAPFIVRRGTGTNVTEIELNATTLDFNGDCDISGALTATSYGGITESDLLDKSVDETVTGNWLMGDGTDISPNSSSAGQLRIEGNAYRGYVALDATGMHFGHNSTSRILTFDTNKTTRMSISGSGAVNVVGALTAATFSGNGASLTTLNAANLSSGIIPLARLSADQHSHGIERAFVNFDRQNGMDLDDYVTAGVYGIGAPATNTPTGVSYDPFIVLENASDVRSQLLVPHTANRPLAWRGITSGTPVDWRYALWGDWDGTSFSVSGVNELKLSSTLFIGGDTTGHFRSVTGDYGSVEVNGTEGSSGSWHGYSIGGRYVFMDNAGDTVGIYNDLDNEWMIKCTRNAEVNLYYNASNKLQTTNTGINVSGDVNAVSFGGIAEANLADETGTNVWSGVNTWTGNNNGFRYGINGDYSAGASSSWGSTIWALDSSWQGGTSGSNSSSASVYGLRWFRNSHANVDSDALEGVYFYRGGTNYAAIGYAGAVFNTTIVASGDITANSDISLKDDLLVINNALEKVGALNGYTFTRNDQEDKTRRTGLIAQEVESVLPEAVSTNEKTGIKSLSYGNLAGLFVEAIKELRAEIEELKAERVKD